MTGRGRRSATQLADLDRRLGRDLLLAWAGPAGAFTDADLASARRPGVRGDVVDLAVASSVAQAAQLLVNRLATRRGELAGLGHPDYGSRHHDLVGQPNTERTRNLVKLYVLEALRAEPRVAAVLRCRVTTAESGPQGRDVLRVELDVRLVDEDTPLNLVVPVTLGGAA